MTSGFYWTTIVMLVLPPSKSHAYIHTLTNITSTLDIKMQAPSPNFLSQTWISGEQLLVTFSSLLFNHFQ